MDCSTCGEIAATIPYIVHESECARHERTVKRLVAALVCCIGLAAISNLAWLYAWTQYDYESTEYTQDGAGLNIIGDGNAGITYGAEIADQTANQEKWQN